MAIKWRDYNGKRDRAKEKRKHFFIFHLPFFASVWTLEKASGQRCDLWSVSHCWPFDMSQMQPYSTWSWIGLLERTELLYNLSFGARDHPSALVSCWTLMAAARLFMRRLTCESFPNKSQICHDCRFSVADAVCSGLWFAVVRARLPARAAGCWSTAQQNTEQRTEQRTE